MDTIFLIEHLSRELARFTQPIEVQMNALVGQHLEEKWDKCLIISIKSSEILCFRRRAPQSGDICWGKDKDHLGLGATQNRRCYGSCAETRFART